MRSTEHFNQLTEAEAERLALLIEECSEVQKCACKVLRHGYTSDNKGEMAITNRGDLEREIGDLWHAVLRMIFAHDVEQSRILQHRDRKTSYIARYLHHQLDAARPAASPEAVES